MGTVKAVDGVSLCTLVDPGLVGKSVKVGLQVLVRLNGLGEIIWDEKRLLACLSGSFGRCGKCR